MPRKTSSMVRVPREEFLPKHRLTDRRWITGSSGKLRLWRGVPGNDNGVPGDERKHIVKVRNITKVGARAVISGPCSNALASAGGSSLIIMKYAKRAGIPGLSYVIQSGSLPPQHTLHPHRRTFSSQIWINYSFILSADSLPFRSSVYFFCV
jgi:hypothetical protein